MPKKFSVLTTEELITYMEEFNWRRIPAEMHTHHTWRPDHSNFHGKDYVEIMQGMERSHKQRGFDEIGQHLTLFPDGKWGLCRDFNRDPASITGRNQLGFATEMIGNFDIGHNILKGAQLESMLTMYAYMIHRFMRDNVQKAVVFHNQYAKKTCPGTGIKRSDFVKQVEAKMKGDDGEVEVVTVKLPNKEAKGFLKDGLTYVPVRDVATSLNADVKWDGATKTVTITKKGV